MLLYSALGVCLLSASRGLADSITQYQDFPSLDDCQKNCLQPGDSEIIGSHLTCNTADVDDCLCLKLDQGLAYVDGCIKSACGNNRTEVYQAQSVLANFCTAEASLSGSTVFPTTIMQPTGLLHQL